MLDLKSLGENMVASSAATFRHTDDWSKILWECSLPDWLGTITVWSNGCCDYDWLFLSSKEGAFAHCEFSSLEEAIAAVGRELRNFGAGLPFSMCIHEQP